MAVLGGQQSSYKSSSSSHNHLTTTIITLTTKCTAASSKSVSVHLQTPRTTSKFTGSCPPQRGAYHCQGTPLIFFIMGKAHHDVVCHPPMALPTNDLNKRSQSLRHTCKSFIAHRCVVAHWLKITDPQHPFHVSFQNSKSSPS